jgi:hypothetical protein
MASPSVAGYCSCLLCSCLASFLDCARLLRCVCATTGPALAGGPVESVACRCCLPADLVGHCWRGVATRMEWQWFQGLRLKLNGQPIHSSEPRPGLPEGGAGGSADVASCAADSAPNRAVDPASADMAQPSAASSGGAGPRTAATAVAARRDGLAGRPQAEGGEGESDIRSAATQVAPEVQQSAAGGGFGATAAQLPPPASTSQKKGE